MLNIEQRLLIVQEQIRLAEQRYHRAPGCVKLLAVSKKQPTQKIQAAINAGQCWFGENYVQEGVEKINTIKQLDLTWHFIGPIQSNKSKTIAQNFSWVHSVCSKTVATALNKQRPADLPALNVCIQVNTSVEASKAGISAEQINELAELVNMLPNLRLRGLMSIPASSNNFEQQRKGFAQLRKCFDQLKQQGFDLDTLSMGMSNDLEAAIAEGATIVRIGSAIFGPRS